MALAVWMCDSSTKRLGTSAAMKSADNKLGRVWVAYRRLASKDDFDCTSAVAFLDSWEVLMAG